MPKTWVVHSLALVAAGLGAHYADSALVAWPAMVLLLWCLMPVCGVDVSDMDRTALEEAFRGALADCAMTLKQAAAWMDLEATDLVKALRHERRVDLFWRLEKLPAEWRRNFHLRRLVQLGLPDRINKALKVAAFVDVQERSARCGVLR